MKKAYIKNVFRTISNNKRRYVAILAIISLGIAFYVGLRSTSPDMNIMIDEYFDSQNMYDLRGVTTLGISDDDVDVIKSTPGVTAVMPAYYCDEFVQIKEGSHLVRLHSIDVSQIQDNTALNMPVLVVGDYPKNNDECLLDYRHFRMLNCNIGDYIDVSTGDESDIFDDMKSDKYKIVGAIESPLYIMDNVGTSSKGQGYIKAFAYIPIENFNSEFYTEVYIKTDTAGLARLSDEYKEKVDEVKSVLEKDISFSVNKRYSDIIEDGEEKINVAKIDIEKAQKEFDDTWAMLSAAGMEIDAETSEVLDQTERQIKEAWSEIYEHEEQLEKLKADTPAIYVLDLDTNIGYVSFKGDSERIDAISYVFPFIFFLVAALVTLTNMMRIVEDDRSTIGVLKSLGYSKYYVFTKYMIYSVLVAVPGGIIGVLVGHRLFPSSIYNLGYKILYNTPDIAIVIHLDICILALILAFISIIAPTIAVCYSEVVSPPANLIRPKAPRSGKRIILERMPFIWNRLNFFAKVTARNILRYKKRFFMTVAGIAGCTALIVTGFGIIDSIKYVPVKQFENIFLHDGTITLKHNITDNEKREIENFLNENNNNWLYTYNMAINAENNNRIEDVTITVPQRIQKVPDFFVFKSKSSGDKNKEIFLDNSGVIMTEKICSLLGYKAGDTITLVSDNRRISVKLLGICENYVNNYVYITPQLYCELFGVDNINYKTIICKTEDNTEEKEKSLSSELMTMEGVEGVSFNRRTVEFYSNMINSLNFVVIILVLSAAALAFVVLFSLTAINIDERMNELATLKVLGFYNFETSKYIFRENIILTVIGTITGLGLGVILHRYVMKTVEVNIIMFAKEILPISFMYSALLTISFSLIVNFAMNFSIKKINMVEALKSTE